MKSIIIGLGGIGSALVYPLARYLNCMSSECSSEKPEIVLIDGDSYEKKNFGRQVVFSKGIGMNKAEYHANRLARIFEDLKIGFNSEFVNRRNIANLLSDGGTIFGCVDNHATRRMLQEFCLRLQNTLLISGGNEYTDGNIQVFLRHEGKNLTPPIWTAHEEIRFPRDKSPEEMSCEELMSAEPQLIFTNFMVAALMLNAYYGFSIVGVCDYSEAYFDIATNKVRPVTRKEKVG